MQKEDKSINFRILLILLLFPIIVLSQLSKTHYIPPLTSAEFGNANPEEQYIYISTPSTSNISYTIKPAGQTISSYLTGIVSNTNPAERYIGTGNSQLFAASSQTSVITSNKGYIVEAEGPIYVSFRMNAGGGAQAGALVSKGLSALGKTFRVGSFTNENPQNNYLNFVSVMATQDNTKVTFSELTPGIIIKNYSGTTPIVVTLNKEQSYTIATNSSDNSTSRDGLIGTLIKSDKYIVVNCGSANGSFHNGGSRDYGIDQIVGLSKVGKEYIFVRGGGSNGWENILIVAHSNNTNLSINGASIGVTINAGDYYLIEGDKYNNAGNMYVETTEPVFAYQGVGATTSEANQGMYFVPPLSCETRGNLDNIAHIEDIGNTTYSGGISIVTKKGATITINNQSTTNFNTAGPSNVTGNPDYVTYKVTGLSNNVSVQSDAELYCAYFNYNGAATSGSFYSGFPSPPEIDFDAKFETLGICIPNITLSASNGDNFDSFEWHYDDGNGFSGTGMKDVDFTPIDPGTYKLIGILNCSGLELESQEVLVSICPDDFDNDGIIDNIDVDNDNDGILNCDESNGDQAINLTNINGGVIPVGGYSFTGVLTPVGNLGSTINGASNGTFMSEVPNKNGTPVTHIQYRLNFNKNVNLRLAYPTSSNLGNGFLTHDAAFTIQVPNTRTITLYDPDDQLLVDTNYDGIFEAGVTLISSFEIRFKLTSSSLAFGAGTFSFYANNVDGFTYTHSNNSTTNANQATFEISATCVALDSDNDGIEDSIDADSDNDAIPDIIENKGAILTLSNSDMDNDGLDDIFNTSDLPLDSDGDGIFDYLDLDSDNDGIFDLEESNSLFPDLDFDGHVDNAATTIGLNGWIDAAETAPDTGLIGYTIRNTDTDITLNYIDNDSDGDNCFDVFEAGFSDANNDGYLGDSTITVNSNGIVTTAADGYTTPNSNYLNGAPILIEIQPFDTTPCALTNASISIESSTAETYQWEVSTDGINWNILINDTIYSNSQTNTLNINSISSSYASHIYRVYLNRIGNSCGLYSDEVSLTVFDLPVLNAPTIYSQCDDASNDGIAQFNLTLEQIKEEISPNYIAENLVFTYFNSSIDAQNASNLIAFPSTYKNLTPFVTETVWIRAENSNGCFSLVSIDLEVNPSSAALSQYNPAPMYQCDDGAAVRDGISTFDLTPVHDYISNVIFSTFSTSVHFYENLTDAELETNEILNISTHQNINFPSIQTIWVRIKSDLGNNCLGLEGFPNLLNVESLPLANTVATYIECDDDQDGTFPFNTSNLESNILHGQSLTNVSITYFDIQGNALTDENGTQISSPFPPTFNSKSQIISYTLTNKNTNDPKGACTDSNTLEFIVDQLPINTAVTIPPLCDPKPDDGLLIADFDTANLETDIGAQPGMDITYFDTNMNPLQDAFGTIITSPFPSSFTTKSQTINVVVTNPINTKCSTTNTIDFTVYELPDFSVESFRIICESGPNSTITLEVYQDNPSEVLDYQWTNEIGDFNSSDKSIEVASSGIYTVTLIKTDGTLCSRSKVIDIVYSETAKITYQDVTILDDSDNNTIAIDATNLGKGIYEYALDDAFGIYQDESFFERVMPGIHLVFVRDKNGCGIASLEVSVVGFPRFLTPNNDGQNDTWKILGVNENFYSTSVIYIYDRFGKMLAKVNPMGSGWDGYYHGVLLPSGDYWFNSVIVDSNGNQRIRKGHFSLIRR